MRAGLAPVLAGAAFGLGAALLAGQAMTSLLYGLSRFDPVSFALVTVLAGAAGLASCLPARRTTAIDPAAALRAE